MRGSSYLRVLTADDPCQPNTRLRVGDEQRFGVERSVYAVQCFECLAVPCAADDDVVISDLVVIKGVQRLPELEHHEVSGIYDVVDRSLAD